MGEGLADLDRRLVHEFDGDRDDAGSDDIGDAGAGLFRAFEAEEHGARAFRLGDQPHRRLGDDAELAFGAADEAEQIVARRIQRLAAELDHRAVEQHHLDAEQIVGRDAVFQAVGAAGIHADIAADRAGELRARIGRIEKTVRRDGFGNVEIGDARLNDGRAVRQDRFRECGSSSTGRARPHPPAGWRRPRARCRRRAARRECRSGGNISSPPRPRPWCAARRRQAAHGDRRRRRRSRTAPVRAPREPGIPAAADRPDRRRSGAAGQHVGARSEKRDGV